MIQRNMVLAGLSLAILLAECVSSTTAATKTCDFETDLCGFATNTAKESAFRVAKVSTAPNGPTVDHEPGTDQGSCAYASTTGVSFLRIPSKGPFCFTGWYHHSGIRTVPASFQSVQEGGKNITFRFATSGVSSSWQRVVYSETRLGTHQV
ncbi:MAM and LDL-receptor class A domain-containing protein 2 [Ixodes scapularis]